MSTTRVLARLHGFIVAVCLGDFVVLHAAGAAVHHSPAAV